MELTQRAKIAIEEGHVVVIHCPCELAAEIECCIPSPHPETIVAPNSHRKQSQA
jgi:hypothetical protein